MSDPLLPPRQAGDEDVFVASFADAPNVEALEQAITAALEARRPRLAARLVGLLDRHVEVEPGSDIERARNAARMMLLRRNDAFQQAWEDLEEAWRRTRKRRMGRIKHRVRDVIGGRSPRSTRKKRR